MDSKKRSSVLSIGITIDESRKKREEQTLSLRKKERDERFSKRRLYGSNLDKDSIDHNIIESVRIYILFNYYFKLN